MTHAKECYDDYLTIKSKVIAARKVKGTGEDWDLALTEAAKTEYDKANPQHGEKRKF